MHRERLVDLIERAHREHRPEVPSVEEVAVARRIEHHDRPHRATIARFERARDRAPARGDRRRRRAMRRARRSSVDQREPLRARHQPRHFIGEGGQRRARHQRPPRRHAGLPRVAGHAHEHGPRRRARVGVAEHDRAVRSREFERRRDQPRRAHLRDRPPDGRRAGEDDMVEALVGEHAPTFLARRAAHLDRAAQGRRRTVRRLDRELQQPRLSPRRPLGGLHHHLVAREHRLHQLDAEQLHRVVPGRDHQHAPNRKTMPLRRMPEPEEPAAAHPLGTQQTRAAAQMPVARRDQGQDVRHHRLEARLADLLRRQRAQLRMVHPDRVAKATQPSQPDIEGGGGLHRARAIRFCAVARFAALWEFCNRVSCPPPTESTPPTLPKRGP